MATCSGFRILNIILFLALPSAVTAFPLSQHTTTQRPSATNPDFGNPDFGKIITIDNVLPPQDQYYAIGKLSEDVWSPPLRVQGKFYQIQPAFPENRVFFGAFLNLESGSEDLLSAADELSVLSGYFEERFYIGSHPYNRDQFYWDSREIPYLEFTRWITVRLSDGRTFAATPVDKKPEYSNRNILDTPVHCCSILRYAALSLRSEGLSSADEEEIIKKLLALEEAEAAPPPSSDNGIMCPSPPNSSPSISPEENFPFKNLPVPPDCKYVPVFVSLQQVSFEVLEDTPSSVEGGPSACMVKRTEHDNYFGPFRSTHLAYGEPLDGLRGCSYVAPPLRPYFYSRVEPLDLSHLPPHPLREKWDYDAFLIASFGCSNGGESESQVPWLSITQMIRPDYLSATSPACPMLFNGYVKLDSQNNLRLLSKTALPSRDGVERYEVAAESLLTGNKAVGGCTYNALYRIVAYYLINPAYKT